METTLTAIERLQMLCSNPILPTAYSESLSYIQQLACFSDKLNEVIERLNEFTGDYESYVQEQLAPYNARLEKMESQLDTLADVVELKIKELETNVETAIKDNESYVNSTVSDLKNYVSKTDTKLRAYIDGKLLGITNKVDAELDAMYKQVQTYVTGEISKQLTVIFAYIDSHNDDLKIWVTAVLDEFLQKLPKNSVIVINPITGVVDTLQNALNAIANACKWNTLTVNEWDALRLTAEKFDTKLLSAYTIDWESREKLVPHKWAYMFSPFTGEFTTIESVINNLANFHKEVVDGAISADTFDKAQLTAKGYDDLQLTAFTYDWHASKYITAA